MLSLPSSPTCVLVTIPYGSQLKLRLQLWMWQHSCGRNNTGPHALEAQGTAGTAAAIAGPSPGDELWPQRSCCLPQHYRGSQPIGSKGEEFNIHNHSDVSEEPQLDAPCRAAAAGANSHQMSNQLTFTNWSDPLLTDTSQTLTNPLATHSKKAQDIDHFFTREEEGLFCNFCP